MRPRSPSRCSAMHFVHWQAHFAIPLPHPHVASRPRPRHASFPLGPWSSSPSLPFDEPTIPSPYWPARFAAVTCTLLARDSTFHPAHSSPRQSPYPPNQTPRLLHASPYQSFDSRAPCAVIAFPRCAALPHSDTWHESYQVPNPSRIACFVQFPMIAPVVQSPRYERLSFPLAASSTLVVWNEGRWKWTFLGIPRSPKLTRVWTAGRAVCCGRHC
mmetsp:Transcript_9977/g.22118  ORF Transcript_9977/g.22118 Transcript_9977/m.22118 type:complete len:215 (-) Transcript_9977:180-824(-)